MYPGRGVTALFCLSSLLAAACNNPSEADARPDVVASFYPIAYAAQEVGGNLVEVQNLTPPGAEPHDLELTPGQARALSNADLVLYLGDGFQPSLEDAIEELDGNVVDILASQEKLLAGDEHEEEGHGEEGDDHAEEGASDPHVWLDPQRMASIASLVGEQLGEADPDHARAYRKKAADLESRLGALDTEFRDGLGGCRRDSVVTSHQAFGYLAAAYGLEEIGIAGIDPEAEPSARRLAEVTRFVEANDVTTIYFEVLVPPDVARTLAREASIDTAALDPLEGPPKEGDYFTAMRANLKALRHGLGCT